MRKQDMHKLHNKPHMVNGHIVQSRGASHNNRTVTKSKNSSASTFIILVAAVALVIVALYASLTCMRSQLWSSSSSSAQSKTANYSKSTQTFRRRRDEVLARKKRAKWLIDPNSYAVRIVLEKMSLEDKVAQMFMVKPEDLVGFRRAVISSGTNVSRAFNSLPVGGVMYSRENIQNPEQTKRMISGLQAMSQSRVALPAFVSVDEEGGTVARISSNPSMGVNPSPNMSDIGATGKTRKAYEAGQYIGKYLSDFGFNIDFAPVADVITNPNNELMKYRSFGSKPNRVKRMAMAFTNGLQASKVFATYKHFPGHGSTSSDSHQGVTISNQSSLDLRKTDLVPFKDAVENGVKFIMVSHVSYPKVTSDETPASMSEKIVTGIARKKLKYGGILISDSLGMGAITSRYNSGNAAITGIKAGLDMLLSPANLRQAYYAVVNAVRNGTIPESRINESVKRIIAIKLQIANQTKQQK